MLTDRKDIDRAVDILVTAQRMAADGLTETRRAVHAKHAPGQRVAVQLDYGEHDVRLTVVNGLAEGRAAPAGPGTVTGGYGLTGMQERLRLLNGTLVAGPRDGQWAATAELPLPPVPSPQDVTS